MLLRNLNPSIGLMNGTRLQVKRLLDNVLIATILGGKCEGQDVMIPKIPMAPSDCVYQFKRFQFPVRLSYCMTVNKSQGQTLGYTGLFLELKECFEHGQFYVSMTRVDDERKVFATQKMADPRTSSTKLPWDDWKEKNKKITNWMILNHFEVWPSTETVFDQYRFFT